MKSMLKSQKPESEAPVKYYAVIDTNVLVSAALKWKSVPGSIVDLAFNERRFRKGKTEEFRCQLRLHISGCSRLLR